MLDRSQEVVRVRLISSDGVVLEDKVQDGLVMFIASQKIHFPIQVEIYDQVGKLVGNHPWPISFLGLNFLL